jgi:iron-sulfur cluster assembly protein
VLIITEKAFDKVRRLAQKDGLDPVLRVGVKGGGCTGLSYFMDFDAKVRETDHVIESDEVRILCDPKSLEFLKETTLDYDTNLLSGGFKFKNPQAKKTCSCGESFTV